MVCVLSISPLKSSHIMLIWLNYSNGLNVRLKLITGKFYKYDIHKRTELPLVGKY